jgi:hypothetical protein
VQESPEIPQRNAESEDGVKAVLIESDRYVVLEDALLKLIEQLVRRFFVDGR